MGDPSPKLKLEGISKEFRGNGSRLPVLRALDFEAREGELVSIIGPSGCGKSTLLNIVAGLEEPDTGRIWLDGRQMPRRLGQMGYMQQKDLLLPWRTVLDNAILGLEVRGMPRPEARHRAGKLMAQFGLSGFERVFPPTLSGGMRQRAAFLRAVLPGHQLILLDEPFGALDALTRTQMQEWLLAQWESLGSTVVLVTHDVDEAVFLSDRVYVLTARPARVSMVVEVPLPRPRRYAMTAERSFVETRARLMMALRGEGAGRQEGQG